MPMYSSDSLHGGARGSIATLKSYAAAAGATHGYAAFIDEIYRASQLMTIPIDPAIACMQSSQETGWWGGYEYNKYWNEQWNPGGIGIYLDDGSLDSPFNRPVASAAESARLLLLDLWLHMYGSSKPIPSVVQDVADIILPGWGDEVIELTNHPLHPRIRTIDDLNIKWYPEPGNPSWYECTWACDPYYERQICDRAYAVWGETLADSGTTANEVFTQNDLVTTSDSVRFRSARDLTAGSIIGTLTPGTEGCALGAASGTINGYTWLQVKIKDKDSPFLDQTGYIATNYLDIVTKNATACSSNTAGDPTVFPVSGFRFGDILQVTENNGHKLRATASKTGVELGVLPDNDVVLAIGTPVLDSGGTKWIKVHSRYGQGYLMMLPSLVERDRYYFGPNNLYNAKIDNASLSSGPFSHRGATVTRVSLNGNWRAKVVSDGIQERMGVSWRTHSSNYINLKRTYAFAVVDVTGNAATDTNSTVDYMALNVTYTDGTTVTLGTGPKDAYSVDNIVRGTRWSRQIIGHRKLNTAKLVQSVALFVGRSDAAPATFYVDNAQIVVY